MFYECLIIFKNINIEQSIKSIKKIINKIKIALNIILNTEGV